MQDLQLPVAHICWKPCTWVGAPSCWWSLNLPLMSLYTIKEQMNELHDQYPAHVAQLLQSAHPLPNATQWYLPPLSTASLKDDTERINACSPWSDRFRLYISLYSYCNAVAISPGVARVWHIPYSICMACMQGNLMHPLSLAENKQFSPVYRRLLRYLL